jgi:hypothetical protein
MAATGGYGPLVPHMRPLALQHQMDGQQPPKQADIIFEAVEGVYGPKNL